jgi:hypothetical protein
MQPRLSSRRWMDIEFCRQNRELAGDRSTETSHTSRSLSRRNTIPAYETVSGMKIEPK